MIFRDKIVLILLSLYASYGATAQPRPWTLQQCIDTAIANNISVQQFINAIELDGLALKQSKNNLLPAINGNASQGLNFGHSVNPATGQYQTSTYWSTGAGLTLAQNLFDGLQYLNTIKQNELIYQSSRYNLEDARFNLTVSVVNDFLQVLYAAEAVLIAQNQLNPDTAQVQNISNMLYIGKKTPSDLLQIQSQLSSDQFALVNAQSQWRIAKVNLEQLMNLAVSDSFDIDYTAPIQPGQNPGEDINSVYAKSLGFQPIIKSYQLQTEGAMYSVKIARGAYYPQLLFKGTFGTDYTSNATQTLSSYSTVLENIGYLQGNPSEEVLGNVSQEKTTVNNYPFGNQVLNNLNGSFSLGLAIPILNYLQVHNNVKKQRVNLNNAVLNEQNTKLNLRKTIEQIYTSVVNSEAQYKAALEEVKSSKAAYDVSLAMYNDGKEIITDLLIQKTAYLKAQSDYLQAKYGLLFNIKIMDYYQGLPLTF